LLFDIASKDESVPIEVLMENMCSASTQHTLHGELCIYDLPAAEVVANDLD
jgi:hypothetical protein